MTLETNSWPTLTDQSWVPTHARCNTCDAERDLTLDQIVPMADGRPLAELHCPDDHAVSYYWRRGPEATRR